MAKAAVLPAREDGYARKKWSVRDCRFLVDSGLLDPGKYELIEGEIVSKMGQSRLHIGTVTRILAALAAIFDILSLQSQAQIGIGELDAFNDPEPDVAVLRGTTEDYLDHEPNPATDVLLAVEASLTTLPGDQTTKAQLYARHSIREYWIVAIARRELIVHRQPTANGYADVRTYGENEAVAPLSAPGRLVQVSALMP